MTKAVVKQKNSPKNGNVPKLQKTPLMKKTEETAIQKNKLKQAAQLTPKNVVQNGTPKGSDQKLSKSARKRLKRKSGGSIESNSPAKQGSPVKVSACEVLNVDNYGGENFILMFLCSIL